MSNKAYAMEWIDLSNRHLETAALLLRENHYTDSIAIELHQCVEKAFKSVYAFYGESIPKTHSLPVLFNFVSIKVKIEELNIDDIIIISDYYESDRYPGPRYVIPSRSEVENFYLLIEQTFRQITELISFNPEHDSLV
jgi:HEPN domain-containing protein